MKSKQGITEEKTDASLEKIQCPVYQKSTLTMKKEKYKSRLRGCSIINF